MSGRGYAAVMAHMIDELDVQLAELVARHDAAVRELAAIRRALGVPPGAGAPEAVERAAEARLALSRASREAAA